MGGLQARTIFLFVIVVVLAVIAWGVLTMPDSRGVGQRISDAAHALPSGVDAAGRQLESRTPGEKLGDAFKDTGDDIKKNTGN